MPEMIRLREERCRTDQPEAVPFVDDPAYRRAFLLSMQYFLGRLPVSCFFVSADTHIPDNERAVQTAECFLCTENEILSLEAALVSKRKSKEVSLCVRVLQEKTWRSPIP